jgi:DNA repair protein RecO (recombination protein O)
MPTYQTNGIIIGRTNFGEADRVIRLLTPDHGKVSAVAKGIRKLKSRNAGHLEPLGETNLMLARGRNLDTITSARLVWYPHQLAASYEALSLAFAFATAIDRLTEPGQASPQLYATLKEALQTLDGGASGNLPELWFKLRLLNLLGYLPELTTCTSCSQHDTTGNYSFSPARGGIVCQADTTPGDYPMMPNTIKFWRLLSAHPYAVATAISQAEALAQDSLAACDAFYEHHLGRAFRPTELGI